MKWMIIHSRVSSHESRVSVLQAWVHVRQKLCNRAHRETGSDASDLRRSECSNDRLGLRLYAGSDCRLVAANSSLEITTARRRPRAMWAWCASSGPTRPTSVSANGAYMIARSSYEAQRCTFRVDEWWLAPQTTSLGVLARLDGRSPPGKRRVLLFHATSTSILPSGTTS